MADDQLRPHRGRRRAGRLCRGDPRGAARHEDRGRRARASGRHLPQLGLHPDQGAAAHLGDLPPDAACRRVRLLGQGHLASIAKKVVERSRKVAKQLSATASAFLMKKNKITVFDGDGQARRQAGKLAVAKDGKTGRRRSRAKHIILATGARARAAARASSPTASWSGPTRRRWCRRRCPSRCWSSARARSASSSPASTAPWAPR